MNTPAILEEMLTLLVATLFLFGFVIVCSFLYIVACELIEWMLKHCTIEAITSFRCKTDN
jgi:hypothetical protein